MTVYADILIVLNLIVDYFLLSATRLIIRRKTRLWRMLVSSMLGGIFSLYIFLPQTSVFIETAVRIVFCFAAVSVAFGFVNLKEFLKAAGVFFLISCLYASLMMLFWKMFKPDGMVINNSVVYFDISALALIVCTVIFYILFALCSKIFASNGQLAGSCVVKLTANGRQIEFTAMLDTGNSLNDVFGNSEVIIADKSIAQRLFDSTDINLNPALKSRYRAVPLATVSGSDMLDGFRCDSAVAVFGKETAVLKSPIIAISKTRLDSGFDGIVNPKIFRNVGEENVPNYQKIYK